MVFMIETQVEKHIYSEVINKPINLNNLKPNENRRNFAILIFLYFLQGIPIGIAKVIPIKLQRIKSVQYADQGTFGYSGLPFCMKLLWAPIVDVLFSRRFGRRKSWLVPTQILIGLIMILASTNIDSWMGEGDDQPNVIYLTIIFTALNLLAATQDIAVDGWALTLLHHENVGYASTCGNIGQTIGTLFSYPMFLVLNSADFCNTYLYWARRNSATTGIVSMSTFMLFWGAVFLVSTALIAIFKNDNSLEVIGHEETDDMSIIDSYKYLWQILKLKPIQLAAIFLLTAGAIFGPSDVVPPLKLVDQGVPEDSYAIISSSHDTLKILLTLWISKHIIGSSPLNYVLATVLFKIIIIIVEAVFIFYTPFLKTDNIFPTHYYFLLFLITGLNQVIQLFFSLGIVAFIAQVSDPKSGGTYMTLLTTLINLSVKWSSLLSLFLIDRLTIKKCSTSKDYFSSSNSDTNETCELIDGYYVETSICVIVFTIWLLFGKFLAKKIHKFDRTDWLIDTKSDVSKPNANHNQFKNNSTATSTPILISFVRY